MKIKSIVLWAAAASIVSVTSASAVTVGPHALAAESVVTHQVDYKNNRKHYKNKNYRHRGSSYHKGHNKRPPHGWHRHNKRPGDWSRRGCIAIGSIWWCP